MEERLGMKTIGYIATSLDGYIARKDGSLDWLEQDCWADPDGSDYGWKAHLASVDAMIMGKNTFLKILDIGQWVYGDLPVFVASKSLRGEDVPEHLRTKVSIISGTASELAKKIREKNKSKIYVDGGKLLQSFIRACILNELVVTKMPVLIGSGISLFGEIDKDMKVKNLKTESFKSGVTQNHYEFHS